MSTTAQTPSTKPKRTNRNGLKPIRDFFGIPKGKCNRIRILTRYTIIITILQWNSIVVILAGLIFGRFNTDTTPNYLNIAHIPSVFVSIFMPIVMIYYGLNLLFNAKSTPGSRMVDIKKVDIKKWTMWRNAIFATLIFFIVAIMGDVINVGWKSAILNDCVSGPCLDFIENESYQWLLSGSVIFLFSDVFGLILISLIYSNIRDCLLDIQSDVGGFNLVKNKLTYQDRYKPRQPFFSKYDPVSFFLDF